MNTLNTYSIDLKAMCESVKTFHYVLDDAYFALLEDADIQHGELEADVTVKRTSMAFELNFHLCGYVEIPCDRCLDMMRQEVDTEQSLRVKFGEAYDDEGELIVIPEDEGTVNVAWFMYEFIGMALPVQHMHPEGECNPQMMEVLKQHLTNVMPDADGEKEKTDSRWDALKNILNN